MAYHGPSRHLGLQYGLWPDEQAAVRMDFPVQSPIDPDGAGVGDHTLELHILPNEGHLIRKGWTTL